MTDVKMGTSDAYESSVASAFSYAGLAIEGQELGGLSGSCRQEIDSEAKTSKVEQVGQFSTFHGNDPISFQLFDSLTGQLLFSDWIFKSEIIITRSRQGVGGYYRHDQSGLLLDASDAEIHMAYNPAYTLQQGTLDLVVIDGLVSSSSDSGVFDGLLPTIGTTAPLYLGVSGTQQIDFDLTSLAKIYPTDVKWQLEFGSIDDGVTESFAAVPQPVPVPATVWLFGTGILGELGIRWYRSRRRPYIGDREKRCQF